MAKQTLTLAQRVIEGGWTVESVGSTVIIHRGDGELKLHGGAAQAFFRAWTRKIGHPSDLNPRRIVRAVASVAAPAAMAVTVAVTGASGTLMTVRSPAGRLHARIGLHAVRIIDVYIDADQRGRGHAVALYSAALRSAHARGLRFESDSTVEPGAVRVWAALKRRGLDVVRNPAAQEAPSDEEEGNFVYTNSAVGAPFLVVTVEREA